MTHPIDILYQRTGHLVRRRCAQMLRDEEEAADVTQAVYLKAFETGFVHRSDAESLAWLYQAATRRCLQIIRDGGVRTRLRLVHAEDLLPERPADPEAELGGRQVFEKVLREVDARTGEIALATWGMGLSNERVAEMLGVSVRTVGRARADFEQAARRWREREVG